MYLNITVPFASVKPSRLIETWDVFKRGIPKVAMPAIEGLIETWDVFKPYSYTISFGMDAWLIETWDVFKLKKYHVILPSLWINRNMRCI